MAMYNYYDGRQPQLYYYHDPPTSPDLQAPVTFLDPRRHSETYRREERYVDDSYGRNDRLIRDSSDYSRHGLMPMEAVVRREGAGVSPWWLNREYPYHFQPRAYQYHPWQYEAREDSRRPHDHPMTVEMYVPLCCDECARKVRKHLNRIEGVESVSADLWEKKVVVVGHDLRPHFLLRRMQRDKPGSVFWPDRPR